MLKKHWTMVTFVIALLSLSVRFCWVMLWWTQPFSLLTPPVKVNVTQSCRTLCDPIDYTVHGILQARILEWVAFPFSRGSSQPRDQTQVSCIEEDCLPAEPQGKPKNNGVGSLSRLQGIFLTQEWNQGLLHCRWVLYHLSYLGSPLSEDTFIKTTFSGLKEWEYWQNRRIFKRVSY